MKYQYEIHPTEGGQDAATFATELGNALAKSFDATVSGQRVIALESRYCL